MSSTVSSKLSKIAQSIMAANPSVGRISKNTIPLLSPRRKQPTYLLNSNDQPIDLLPMKLAAFRDYPNLFNASCNFFNSIQRDQHLQRPESIIRVTQASLDLAKVLRNLGIISSFSIGQKTNLLSKEDFVWQQQVEPSHAFELKTYKYKFLRLELRWELLKPIWQLSPSSSPPLSSTPLVIPGEHLPLSVKNVSKASRPVLMTSKELLSEKAKHPSGLFIAYNDRLGITTCAFLEQLQLPGLVLAHLGLPFSHVAQVQAAARHKISSEASVPLELMGKLKDWSMVEWVSESIQARTEADRDSKEKASQVERINRLVGATKRESRIEAGELDRSGELAREIVGLSVALRSSRAMIDIKES